MSGVSNSTARVLIRCAGRWPSGPKRTSVASIDNLQRAGAYLQSALDDDDLRKQVREAFRSGRKVKRGATGRNKADPKALIDRAGKTLSATSAAALALGRVEEPPARSTRGRTLAALVIAGGMVAAVAAQDKTNHEGGTHGV